MTGTAPAAFLEVGEALFDFVGGRGDGEAAEGGAAVLAGHAIGDGFGGIDDFIQRDQRIETGERHVRT